MAPLGILLANIEDRFGPEALMDVPFGLPVPAFTGWHATLDTAIVTVKWLFFGGKMRGPFALLFGPASSS